MQGIAAYADNSIVPPGAITSIRKAADMLEGFGREGDIYVVHAAEGETVVPMEVLNSSPKLKAMLFQQMTDLGLEPERYIVGNELNSINPVTGKPEFFLKRIFSGLKNTFKKIAPIIGAVAGTIIAPGIGTAIGSTLGGSAAAMTLGKIAGSALGSGIGSFATSKLAGADTDDALRGALLAGATSGAFSGIGSLLSPASTAATLPLPGEPGVNTPTLMDAVDPSVDFITPDNVTQIVDGGSGSNTLVGSVGEDQLLGQGGFRRPVGISDTGTARDAYSVTTPYFLNDALNRLPARAQPLPSFGDYSTAQTLPRFGDYSGGATIPATPLPALRPPLPQTVEPPPGSMKVPGASVLTQPRAYFPAVPGEPGVSAPMPGAFAAQPSGLAGFFNDAGQFIRGVPGDLLQLAKENKAETALLLGGAGLGVIGALEEQKKAEEAEKAANRRRAQLQAYIADATARYRRPYIRREAGGKVPGKGEGDIVPAMLEPGEFVMNRIAVIGAGNGSQKAGIKRMYAMMRQFEGKS